VLILVALELLSHVGGTDWRWVCVGAIIGIDCVALFVEVDVSWTGESRAPDGGLLVCSGLHGCSAGGMLPFIGGRGAPVCSGSQRLYALRYVCAYGQLVIERTEYHIALVVDRVFRDLKMCRVDLVFCGCFGVISLLIGRGIG